jgi:hypothetical protein
VKARGVIVLAFSGDNVAGASYGETKAECKQIAHTLDLIIVDIMEGCIPVWETEQSIDARQRRADCDREDVAAGLCRGCGKTFDDCDCWAFETGEAS